MLLMPQYVLEIHSSKLDSYSDCHLRGLAELLPQQFRDLGYQINQTPQYIAGIVGSSIHAGVANLHEQKQDKPLACTYNAVDAAKNELQKLITETPGVLFTKNFPDINTIEIHINEYINAYADQVLPIRQAKLIEHKFVGQLADDVTYKTTLDLYTENDILADLKSGAKITPAKNQMGLYLLLLQRSGYQPQGVVLDYMLREHPTVNTGAVRHNPIVYNHTDCMNIAKTTLTKLIEDFRIFSKTGKIDHIMINPRSTYCNQFCPLFGTKTCPGWQRNV